LRANAVNLATFTNALCHRNATPLSVAVLAHCAWGENLARGVAWRVWQRNGTVWQNSMARQSKRNKFSVASVCGQNKAWRHCKFSTEKMGQCLGGGLLSLSLSLSLLALVARLWAKLKGFFTHFIVDFARFIAISSYFVVVFSHLFACKRHFLGHCAFLKFLNALFFGFCALFVILSLCKKATQRVARCKPQQKIHTAVILSVAKNP